MLQFLKRIALVESNFGEHPDTFRPRYFGGIWQVDEIGFNDTKDVVSHRKLLPGKLDRVTAVFGIDWRNAMWKDLLEPLYSGIAAQLHLGNVEEAIPSTLHGQARYWKRYYNRNHNISNDTFITRVTASGHAMSLQELFSLSDYHVCS